MLEVAESPDKLVDKAVPPEDPFGSRCFPWVDRRVRTPNFVMTRHVGNKQSAVGLGLKSGDIPLGDAPLLPRCLEYL